MEDIVNVKSVKIHKIVNFMIKDNNEIRGILMAMCHLKGMSR